MKQLLMFLMLFISLKSFCQQEITIDLSNDKISDQKVTSGSKRLIFLFAMPKESKKKYEIKTIVNNTLPGPLTPGPLTLPGAGDTKAAEKTKLTTDCDKAGRDIANRINLIKSNAASEKGIKKEFDDIQNDIKNTLTGDCQTAAQKLLDQEKENFKQTSILENLKDNQEVIVTIERKGEGDKIEALWEFTLTTPSKVDKWLIHYGFTYQPNIISSYDQFFAKSIPNTKDSFKVTKMNGHPEKAWQNVTPTLVFTHPFSKTYHDFMPAVSIITGTNFSTYTAGIGFSGIIAYNGLVSFGAMYSQKYALNGQYAEGDILKENLNFDQLHAKRGGIELFFTIALRLDKNPFTGSSSSSSGTPAPANH